MGKWEVWQDQKQASIAQGRRRYLRQQADAVFNQNKLRRDQRRAEREAGGVDAAPAGDGATEEANP